MSTFNAKSISYDQIVVLFVVLCALTLYVLGLHHQQQHYTHVEELSYVFGEKQAELKAPIMHIEAWRINYFEKMIALVNRMEHGEALASQVHYGFLSYDMGYAGLLLLQRLERMKLHPEHAYIQKQIRFFRSFKHWGEYSQWLANHPS